MHISKKFYPRLYESISNNIFMNSDIRKKLIEKFPEKYTNSSSPKSVKTRQRGAITPEDFANDIIQIVKENEPNWTVSKPNIRLAPEPEGLSGKYPTVFITINGRDEKFVLRGDIVSNEYSSSTNVKECLVCYFYESKEKYEPFSKNIKNEEKYKLYKDFLKKIIDDIEENRIPGCKEKDVEEVLDFLKPEVNQYNLNLVNTIFNSLSIGNFLRETKFGKDKWIVDRSDLFDYLKKEIGSGIFGFLKPDKWSPMDIVLINPKGDTEEKIKEIIENVKNEDDVNLRLGKINSMFVNDLDSNNPNNLIIAISLKEQYSKSGNAKGFIKRLEPNFEDEYNLSKEEKTWFEDNKKLLDEIKKKRILIDELIKTKLNHFKYVIEKGEIDDYRGDEPLKKYAALKMLLFILNKAVNNKNIFTDIVRYGLSLEKNPTFFLLRGNIEGDEKMVENDMEIFPALGGIQLYDAINENFDGKIKIRDSNESKDVHIQYYIEFSGVIYYAKLSIRSKTSKRKNVQVSIEIAKWQKFKDLNESEKSYTYLNNRKPLNEKFSEDTNIHKDLNIGLSHIIDKYIQEHDTNDSVKFGEISPAIFILHEKLNNAIKKNWIEYILRQGREPIKEWDESDVEIMYKMGVRFIPNLKYFADKKLSYEGENYYNLMFDDWYIFSEYFNKSSLNEKFVKDILNSDDVLYEYFSNDYDFDDILQYLDEQKQKKLFNYLKSICLKFSNKVNEVSNLEELLSLFSEDSSLYNKIGKNVLQAFNEYMAVLQQDSIYEDLKNSIKKQYEMSSDEEFSKDKIKIGISEDGINKLFAAYYLDELKIDHVLPEYISNLNLNVDDFIDTIDFSI